MNKLKTYKKQILIGVILLLAVCALFTAGRKRNATWFENAAGLVITPIQNAVTNIGGWSASLFDKNNDAKTLQQENDALKAQIALLQAENRRLTQYEAENQELSALLGMSQKYPAYPSTGARIIGKDPGNWYHTFVLNQGTHAGLSANMVLTTAEGLVGKITEVGLTYAKGQSLLDSRSSISAMSLRTKDLGVVKGEYSLMDQGLCQMKYIDAEAEILEGDEIVTSSLSSIYPPGIPIGKVKEVRTDSNGLTKYAIIEPFADFKHLDTLLVLGTPTEEASP